MLRFRLSATGLLLSVFLTSNLSAQEEESASQEESEIPVMNALPPELTSMFPVGREFKGVSFPRYEGENLKMVMRAETIIRVDERFLDLFDLVIFVYNSAGESETTISMAEAAYDITTGELASKTPSKVDQPRFTMTGEKMIFELQEQVSRMVGNVRVVIPDAEMITPQFGAADSSSE